MHTHSTITAPSLCRWPRVTEISLTATWEAGGALGLPPSAESPWLPDCPFLLTSPSSSELLPALAAPKTKHCSTRASVKNCLGTIHICQLCVNRRCPTPCRKAVVCRSDLGCQPLHQYTCTALQLLSLALVSRPCIVPWLLLLR